MKTPAQRTSELGSLIWLEFVKRAVLLLSENVFIFSCASPRAFPKSEAGTLFLRLINAEMRESTRRAGAQRSYPPATVRCGALVHTRLKDRIGYRLQRPTRMCALTGFLPLL